METVVPSFTRTSLNTPETGEGISVSTLSVEISNSGSSRSTLSPLFLSQRVKVPSVMLSAHLGHNYVGHRVSYTCSIASCSFAVVNSKPKTVAKEAATATLTSSRFALHPRLRSDVTGLLRPQGTIYLK